MKYAWYSSNDSNQPWPSGYHENIGSLNKAIKDGLNVMYKRLAAWWPEIEKSKTVIIGKPMFGSKPTWEDVVLTENEMAEYVEKQGLCQIGLRYVGEMTEAIRKHVGPQGDIQGFLKICTMKFLKDERAMLIEHMKETAQDYADADGKSATVGNNSLGWYTAEPKAKKTPKAKATSKCGK